jgi:hypothetical protein
MIIFKCNLQGPLSCLYRTCLRGVSGETINLCENRRNDWALCLYKTKVEIKAYEEPEDLLTDTESNN